MARRDPRVPETKWTRAVIAALAGAGLVLVSRAAEAQQPTFHLDRLEVPGAPDDGLVLFRPVTQEKTIFYAQLGLGLSINPLRMQDVTRDQTILSASAQNAITSQFSTYMSAGFELFDGLILGATFPMAWEESGNQQVNPSAIFGNTPTTNYQTGGPAVGDTRVDGRYVFWRSADGTQALGAQLSLFLPTGNGSQTNFGGDGAFAAMTMVTGEWTPAHLPTFIANLGVHFRPDNSIDQPTAHAGLGVSDELRWAIGAMIPIANGMYRLTGTIFGQTGIVSDHTVGNTFFTMQNTPIEWNVEGRTRINLPGSDHWYAGASVGTLIAPGYGAPDFRLVGLIGTYWGIEDTNPHAPDRRAEIRASIHESMKDTDGDGIPDDIDACPTVPEDHKEPDPGDGCPAPSDRDGDGIPDQFDKCPDQPEDKDGIQDQDGCPEDDADQDGIPDTKDACPREPGQPDPDPKKNGCPRFIKLEGSTVRVLQQVHFETASATILPDSFPMLTEIVQLLKATPSIRKMRIEGHTDNRGAADYNLDLSKRRAASVLAWLVGHGIEPNRLESEGYGLTRPIETNDTDAGRLANRRVEFKIIEEDTGNGQ